MENQLGKNMEHDVDTRCLYRRVGRELQGVKGSKGGMKEGGV